MKKIALVAVSVAVLSLPAYAERINCTNALVTNGVCDTNVQIHWGLSMSVAADAKLQTALARKAGWTAQVTCTQAMVDLAQCTAQQLGQQVANPESERQAAKREFKRLLREEYIQSLDAETNRALVKAYADSLVIGTPDTGN